MAPPSGLGIGIGLPFGGGLGGGTPKNKIIANRGSFIITGNPANLIVGRVLQANTGVFTIAGQDAALVGPNARVLMAAPGSYVITGDSMTPLTDRLLPADPGAFALTGNDATLTKGGGGGGDAPETTAFLARTSGLSGTETNAYKALINTLAGSTVFAKGYALHVYTTKDKTTASLNLLGTSFTITEHGTTTFTADDGWAGDGATGYLDTGFVPATHASAGKDKFSIGIYDFTSRPFSSSGGLAMGTWDGGTHISWLGPQNGLASLLASANDPSNDSLTQPYQDAAGFWLLVRDGASSKKAYSNPALGAGSNPMVSTSPFASNTTASDGLSANSIYVFGANIGGSVFGATTDKIGATWIGQDLTGAEAVLLGNALNTFMAAFGKNVF